MYCRVYWLSLVRGYWLCRRGFWVIDNLRKNWSQINPNKGSRCVDKSQNVKCQSLIDPASSVDYDTTKPKSSKAPSKKKKHKKNPRSTEANLFSVDSIKVDVRALDKVDIDFTFTMPKESVNHRRQFSLYIKINFTDSPQNSTKQSIFILSSISHTQWSLIWKS